ncbi:related to MGS1-Maintenance of Genome Stability 1 [Serendipita indica DSM 11827]|uniref:Related to MGS1-Maintenance of Genome Stability 1 n=1 Tax=Serendipita indica (strain DSM 11827) TaxID=1109443 RepID=G4TB11_SERID|nr:related to MGS1-Maintenance of Genome Stability 1 [Serendipita indica DSM 11827]
MGGTVTCPICNREVAETVINKHLDSQCQYPQQNAKLAPIFTSRLGKRGTETRPTGAEPSSSKRQSSPDVVTLDEDDTPTKHTTKRPKTESKQCDSGGNDRETASPRSSDVPSIFTQMSNKSSKASEEVLAASAPLAERLRPRRLEDFVGQEHLTGDSSLLLQLVESQAIGSMILWGPPGCGKTTLARLLSKSVNATFKELSATSSGTSDVKAIFDEAKRSLKLTGKRTILFMDEIQRFNKAQQDIFLPYVENGWITLIGATTENPSFKLNSALLSRCRVFVLERLRDEDIEVILRKAIERVSPKVSSQEGDVTSLPSSSQTLVEGQVEVKPEPRLREIAPEVMKTIVNLSMGDARTALSLLELVLTSPAKVSDKAVISLLRRSVSSRYDRSGEDRYDMISALHKSIRGSDGSAALYWLARMLTGGEDPLYIARRLIVVASEDVGLADNHALPLAVATYSAAQTIGMPECRINLAHCVAYLAEAPKSTRSYEAYNLAEEAAKADETAPVPLHLRNAPTGMMKDLNYGQGYLYNPAYRHPVYQTYLPATLEGSRFLREEGDVTDKIFDENALRKWEWRCNQGRDWPGRSNLAGSTDMTRKP